MGYFRRCYGLGSLVFRFGLWIYALAPYTSKEWLVPCRRVYGGAGSAGGVAGTKHAFGNLPDQGYVCMEWRGRITTTRISFKSRTRWYPRTSFTRVTPMDVPGIVGTEPAWMELSRGSVSFHSVSSFLGRDEWVTVAATTPGVTWTGVCAVA